MQNMLALSIISYTNTGSNPTLTVGQGSTKTVMFPQNAPDNSYWIVFLDVNNPKNKVKEFIIPGAQNSAIPAGLDTYMSNPQYIFVLATKSLITYSVPQGDFYDYLVKYGAYRELQRLEQINSAYGCGTFTHLSYILTGQCGPRGSGPKPASYELGAIGGYTPLLLSVMPQPNGQPPYTLCNNYTFITRH